MFSSLVVCLLIIIYVVFHIFKIVPHLEQSWILIPIIVAHGPSCLHALTDDQLSIAMLRKLIK